MQLCLFFLPKTGLSQTALSHVIVVYKEPQALSGLPKGETSRDLGITQPGH